MKLGAHFLPENFPIFVESVRAAERAGYERAWLVDGQMLWHDVYVYMAHAPRRDGADRSRDRRDEPAHAPPVGHGERARDARAPPPGPRRCSGSGAATTPSARSDCKPVPTAELAATRAAAAGAGWPATRPRGARIRWANERVPIMICATGPKNLRLAGALADIVMIYVGVSAASVRWAIEHVRAGAEEAGRDPDSVEIAALCAMCVSDDQEEAWAECRWAPAACANHIAYALRGIPTTGCRRR